MTDEPLTLLRRQNEILERIAAKMDQDEARQEQQTKEAKLRRLKEQFASCMVRPEGLTIIDVGRRRSEYLELAKDVLPSKEYEQEERRTQNLFNTWSFLAGRR